MTGDDFVGVLPALGREAERKEVQPGDERDLREDAGERRGLRQPAHADALGFRGTSDALDQTVVVGCRQRKDMVL